jgi:L-malate glycosyltransferase
LRLNVLYVSHTGHIGGAELSLLDLLTALPPEVRPALACPAAGPLARRAAAAGIWTVLIAGTAGSLKVTPAQTSRAAVELAVAGCQVARAAVRLRADVIHANSVRAGLAAVPAGRVTGRPVVVHVRDRLPRGRLADASLKLAAGGRTVVLANSAYTADGVTEVVPGAAVRTVHNAVDLARFDPAARDRDAARSALGLPDGAFAAGVVGQITPWKGQLEAVDAVGALADRHPQLQLLVVGEAKFVDAATRYDNRAYLAGLREAIAARGLDGRIRLLGERDDVAGVLRALDALLVPSWEEPFGRVVLEGMAMGVPVLATRVGGPAEIVTDGRDGLLLPAKEPAAWSAALDRVIGDAELREGLGRAGRRRAADFSPDRHVAAVLAAYDVASAGRRATRRTSRPARHAAG